VLLILLGAWGALAPLIGPSFNFGFTPDDAWNLTNDRWWLEVLPGIVVVVGGLLLLFGTDRITASIGGWLAAAGGAWFVVGTTVQPVINVNAPGTPLHTTARGSMVERLTMFDGLGVVIVFIAAWALGALAVVGVRDVRHARRRALRQQEMDAAAAAPVDVRRRQPQTVIDEATPREDNPYADRPGDTNTVVLPDTPAHARTGQVEDTTRYDRPTP
jgi:hypothetical protein